MRSFKEFLNEEQLIEMANAPVDITGCPCIIWIQTKSEDSGFDNIPRIKFQDNKSTNLQSDKLVPISIEDNPQILLKDYTPALKSKDINKIKEWIILNKVLLLKHWNGQITSYETFSKCKKV